MKRILLVVFTAGCAISVFARSFELKAWRGETKYFSAPGFAENEMMRVELPKGFSLARGDVYPVSYRASVDSEFVKSRFDRVVFDGVKDNPEPNGADSIFKLTIDESVKAGDYQLGMLKLHVVNRVLPPPAQWKYYLDLWQHPWAVSRYHGVEPFSAAHYEKLSSVLKTLADCGQKSLTVSILEEPWDHQCYDAYHSMIGRVKTAAGVWKFDYRIFDEYVEFGRKCGIGPYIACYTMCPWGEIVRWHDENGKIHQQVAKPNSKEFEDFWGDFLVDFSAHLKAKGWFENTFIAMDERSPAEVKAIGDFVRAKAPGLKISMAGNRAPSDFKGIEIENYCQAMRLLDEDFLKEVAVRHQANKLTSMYVCCWPPRPNSFMQSPDSESYYLGAYPILQGFDGFLRWAANSWPRDPVRNASFGYWLPGDTFLVYPEGQASMRLLNLREGIVAGEKLLRLKAEGQCQNECALLAKKFNFKAALDGKLNMAEFRKAVDGLVNRD